VCSSDLGRLPPSSLVRMLDNAQVFFNLEIPALVTSSPDIAALSRLLDQADIPLTFMADPAAGDTPAVQAARWLAGRRRTALHELPGAHALSDRARQDSQGHRALLHS